MFQFKQFTVHQDRCAMKVGTDGVLLGAWVDCLNSDKYILDIGTGTGVIALMMAQRVHGALIDAVDIERDCVEQALNNIADSPWSERINTQCIDVANFDNKISYNLIVSNPPFFNDSLLPPDTKRERARHTTTLSFDTLISSVCRLLATNGRFALILPTCEMQTFKSEIKKRLYLIRECQVLSRENGDCKRVICEFSNTPCDTIRMETLAIREKIGNNYTEKYKKTTRDFYLKF